MCIRDRGLAAGILAALESYDGLIFAAHILPVGDLTGVDAVSYTHL